MPSPPFTITLLLPSSVSRQVSFLWTMDNAACRLPPFCLLRRRRQELNANVCTLASEGKKVQGSNYTWLPFSLPSILRPPPIIFLLHASQTARAKGGEPSLFLLPIVRGSATRPLPTQSYDVNFPFLSHCPRICKLGLFSINDNAVWTK